MSDTAIIYHSLTGNTKQYASWIASALSGDLISLKELDSLKLLHCYNKLIFGMPIYGGLLEGSKRLNEYYHELQNKSIFIFTVGVTPPDTASRQLVAIKSLPKRIRNNCLICHLQGSCDIKKLNFRRRFKAAFLISSLRNKQKKKIITPDELEILDLLSNPSHSCDKNNITPLLRIIQDPQRHKQIEEFKGELLYFDENGELCG